MYTWRRCSHEPSLCRKKLTEPLSRKLFKQFAEHLKKEKAKENNAVVENRSFSVPDWTSCVPHLPVCKPVMLQPCSLPSDSGPHPLSDIH